MYSLSGFDATQCNQNFRLSGSPLLIRFNDSTNLDEITEPVAAIPQERFRFNDHNIVAEVTAVKSILSDPPQGKDHSMATVKIDRLLSDDTGNTSTTKLLRGYAKIEPMTIAELNDFIITAQPQEIEFLCTGKVTGFNNAVSSYNTNIVGGEEDNPEDSRSPPLPIIADNIGKTYTFQVRVRSYNFTANHQTFTISRIFDERDSLPLPDYVAHDGNDDHGDDMHGIIS
ncbi:hypothetical protein IGI04_004922 [Brassica rapa subsp. trilocularis]|uniref:Uncharacterized protein n=1 Tax=Brassica rapa subsp. trilocularis TaxID=1813537 RepID=A0ABQ7NCI3_BRACM|nr:hypothetical protein IGI04_004922 [Brassica rapa subsp. trilocularis]